MTDERNPQLTKAVRDKLRRELTTAAAQHVQDFNLIISRECRNEQVAQLYQKLAATLLNDARDRLLKVFGKDEENAA
jgi:hypothetical protein